MFTFTCTGGPYGDATSSYKINLDKEYTVGEFINVVLSSFDKEWGHIGVYKEGEVLGKPYINYRYGKLEDDSSLDTMPLDKKVVSAIANGGWSAMYYWLKIKE